MKWWVDKFTSEIKELVDAKRELISERDNIREAMNNGANYFYKRIDNYNARELENGAKRVVELMDRLKEIDTKITDLDIIIVSKLEMYLGNFIARARMPERLSDAGDLIRHESVYAVPFKSGDDNLIEITPDDIWFLKMIKTAFKATNITFEEKGE